MLLLLIYCGMCLFVSFCMGDSDDKEVTSNICSSICFIRFEILSILDLNVFNSLIYMFSVKVFSF